MLVPIVSLEVVPDTLAAPLAVGAGPFISLESLAPNVALVVAAAAGVKATPVLDAVAIV